jgi:hypothetical protein
MTTSAYAVMAGTNSGPTPFNLNDFAHSSSSVAISAQRLDATPEPEDTDVRRRKDAGE